MLHDGATQTPNLFPQGVDRAAGLPEAEGDLEVKIGRGAHDHTKGLVGILDRIYLQSHFTYSHVGLSTKE